MEFENCLKIEIQTFRRLLWVGRENSIFVIGRISNLSIFFCQLCILGEFRSRFYTLYCNRGIHPIIHLSFKPRIPKANVIHTIQLTDNNAVDALYRPELHFIITWFSPLGFSPSDIHTSIYFSNFRSLRNFFSIERIQRADSSILIPRDKTHQLFYNVVTSSSN